MRSIPTGRNIGSSLLGLRANFTVESDDDSDGHFVIGVIRHRRNMILPVPLGHHAAARM